MELKYQVNVLIHTKNGDINHFVYFSKYDNAVTYINDHRKKGNKVISFREYVLKTNFDIDGEL